MLEEETSSHRADKTLIAFSLKCNVITAVQILDGGISTWGRGGKKGKKRRSWNKAEIEDRVRKGLTKYKRIIIIIIIIFII